MPDPYLAGGPFRNSNDAMFEKARYVCGTASGAAERSFCSHSCNLSR
jgi:hypothetical protein